MQRTASFLNRIVQLAYTDDGPLTGPKTFKGFDIVALRDLAVDRLRTCSRDQRQLASLKDLDSVADSDVAVLHLVARVDPKARRTRTPRVDTPVCHQRLEPVRA